MHAGHKRGTAAGADVVHVCCILYFEFFIFIFYLIFVLTIFWIEDLVCMQVVIRRGAAAGADVVFVVCVFSLSFLD